ncbi:MAG: TonB-dependent receptor [Bryobacterales bacterium]
MRDILTTLPISADLNDSPMSSPRRQLPFAAIPIQGARMFLWAALLLVMGAGVATPQPAAQRDLTELSIEDLLNIEVTSVSRREQKLSQSASAVYVITQEDIRRSGMTTVPDALRMAPGVQVAQIDGNRWAVSIRGFTGRFANKLLVMIDGRTLYLGTSAGVYWEAHDVLLEDVERIEVVRGPGATMWGSNAVNGVINIITRHASETQGGLVSGGGGNQEGGFGGVRFGGRAGPRLHYRLYSKYLSRSGGLLDGGERAADNLQRLQGGFRLDWQPTDSDELMFSGDAADTGAGSRLSLPATQFPYQQVLPFRATSSTANVFGRWARHSSRSRTQLQAFFDHTTADNLYSRFRLNQADIEFQHQMDFSRHNLMWGVGHRTAADVNDSTQWLSLNPRRATTRRTNTFVQDEIVLLPEKLLLSVGSKFETNSFSGWEIQPSVSLLWNLNARQTTWAAVSRAVRTPSRTDRQVTLDFFGMPGPDESILILQSHSDPNFGSEQLWAYEAGYRIQAAARLSFDLAVFYNAYDDIAGTVEGAPFVRETSPLTIVAPVHYTNLSAVDFYGAELAAAWNPLESASLRLNYAWLGGEFENPVHTKGPSHQFHGRWYWNLPGPFEGDSAYYFVDGYSGVPAYHRVDSRLGWQAARGWSLSLVLQNLLDNQHREQPLSPYLEQSSEVGRSVYGKLTWRY